MSNKFSPILERILQLADNYRNESHFSDHMGFSHGYIHNMRKREEAGKKANPSWEVLSTIVEKTGVNPVWLLTGEGEPWEQPETDKGNQINEMILRYAQQLESSGNGGNLSQRFVSMLQSQIQSAQGQVASAEKQLKASADLLQLLIDQIDSSRS